MMIQHFPQPKKPRQKRIKLREIIKFGLTREKIFLGGRVYKKEESNWENKVSVWEGEKTKEAWRSAFILGPNLANILWNQIPKHTNPNVNSTFFLLPPCAYCWMTPDKTQTKNQKGLHHTTNQTKPW